MKGERGKVKGERWKGGGRCEKRFFLQKVTKETKAGTG